MIIDKKKNKIILKNPKNFLPSHILECGQVFRWEKVAYENYILVAKDKVINIYKDENDIVFENTDEIEFEKVWADYFDLNTDYLSIKAKLGKDDIMKKAIEFGKGIRILNQDEFEMLISFMISANNRIPMIKKVIENLSCNFGTKICEYKGKEYFAFPTIKQLANAPVEKIRECKAGFRSERIKEAAVRMLKERDTLYKLKDWSYDEALEYLMGFKGVGNKVANCILLFSMRQFATFPVDVWVRRVMQELYVPKSTTDKQIREFAEDKFGMLSGYAQQYLFYYAREQGIGK